MSNNISYYFWLYHKSPYKTARRFLEKVGVFKDLDIQEDSVSAKVRGRHDWYTVYLGSDGVYCSCMANRGQKFVCWHMIALVLYLYEQLDKQLGLKVFEWIKKYEKQI